MATLSRIAILLTLAGLVPSPAAASDVPLWRLTEGRVQVDVIRWSPSCGPEPTDEQPQTGAWRLLPTADTLVPIDDAPSLFGTGLCRNLLGDGVDEHRSPADIRCTSAGRGEGRLTLRSAGVGRLAVVHQLRLEPGPGCEARRLGTWLLTRDGAPPADGRVAGLAGLAPAGPLPLTPAPTPSPGRTLLAASARPLPPEQAGTDATLPLVVAALMVLVGLIGVWRHWRTDRG